MAERFRKLPSSDGKRLGSDHGLRVELCGEQGRSQRPAGDTKCGEAKRFGSCRKRRPLRRICPRRWARRLPSSKPSASLHKLPIPDDSIAICSSGDASANHATAQTAFNTAAWTAYQKLPAPVLFVCEDNGIGISVKTPTDWIMPVLALAATSTIFTPMVSIWRQAMKIVLHAPSTTAARHADRPSCICAPRASWVTLALISRLNGDLWKN